MDGIGSSRNLMAVIGDEDSVTGLLLAGIGHISKSGVPNFMVVRKGMYLRWLKIVQLK